MRRLPFVLWIANAAVVLCGRRGDVSRQAQHVGCSRQTVYNHCEKVFKAVEDQQQETSPGKADAATLEELEQLRQENQQLWRTLHQCVVFDEERQQQFTAQAAALGLSVTQITCLLAVLLPSDQHPSRSKVGRWAKQAGQRAARLLKVLDAACRSLVVSLAIDEIYLRGKPVLVAVEPQSLAWVLGKRENDCTGQTWKAALEPWSQLEYVAADAGSGIQKGLELTRQDRQQKASPDSPARLLEMGLDIFHIQKEMKTLFFLAWSQVEKLWEAAEKADKKLKKDKQQGVPAHRSGRIASQAWRLAEQAFEEYETMEAAWKRVEQSWGLFLDDGRLNTRPMAEAQFLAAIEIINGLTCFSCLKSNSQSSRRSRRWSSVQRMLTDPRTLAFLDRLHRLLRETVEEEDLRAALVKLSWLSRQRASADSEREKAYWETQRILQWRICRHLSSDWRTAYRQVRKAFGQVVRASSGVEGMNSVIRMHQSRHRMLTQDLLDLKRLYWNVHAFREGKRRRRSPYELLGLPLPDRTFCQLLQMDESTLAAELGVSQSADAIAATSGSPVGGGANCPNTPTMA